MSNFDLIVKGGTVSTASDTFKADIYSIFPNLDFYLNSLYETLEDIFLFFKDLIN